MIAASKEYDTRFGEKSQDLYGKKGLSSHTRGLTYGKHTMSIELVLCMKFITSRKI